MRLHFFNMTVPHFCRRSVPFSSGLTLFEMVVTIGIISMISAIMLLGQSRFNNSIILTNAAFEVAIAMRQAQTYASSVKFTGASGSIDQGYGVHLNSAGGNTTFQLFADHCVLNVENVCGYGTIGTSERFDSNESFSSLTLGRGIVIARFCGSSGFGEECYQFSPTAGGTLTYMDIMFFRPHLTACIRTNLNPPTGGSKRCTTNNPDRYTRATIYLRSPEGNERSVIIYRTGQVNVE
jgi:Tfp pilus assembly protein FimT